MRFSICNKNWGLGSLLAMILLLAGQMAFGQSSKDLKAKERDLLKKIENTRSLILEAKKSQDLTLTQLAVLNRQILYREELINNIEYQKRKLDDLIQDNKKSIAVLENEIVYLKSEYAKLVRYAYKMRNTDYKLMYIFSAGSLNQAYQRLKFIQDYAEFRKRQVQLIQRRQEELKVENENLAQRLVEKSNLMVNATKAKNEFVDDVALQKKSLAKLQKNESKLRSELKAQEKKRQKVARAIKRAIEREMAKAKKSSKGFVITPEMKLAASGFKGNKGRLPWPLVRGEITAKYGQHPHKTLPGIMIDNRGVDISTSPGATVRAIYKGSVVKVLIISGAGKVVIVEHGTYRSVYSNLAEVYVKKGDKVNTKEDLGVLLKTKDNISELHFEIWNTSASGANPDNPENWIYSK